MSICMLAESTMPHATANRTSNTKNSASCPATIQASNAKLVANVAARPNTMDACVPMRADMGPPNALGAMASANTNDGISGSLAPK